MGCTTAGLKSSGTAAVRREPFMIYRTVGPTAGGAGRGNDSRPHVNDLAYKESEEIFAGRSRFSKAGSDRRINTSIYIAEENARSL